MPKFMLALALLCGTASAETTVHYIANAGVMVTDGDSKILFDPLFDNDYGQYYLPLADVREAILNGRPPFDDVDAVLISHVHADHFVSSDVLSLLRRQPSIRLYASAQVVAALRQAAAGNYPEVFDRVTAFALQNRDQPVSSKSGSLTVEAVRIPHSGWPETHARIENIAFRVVLASGVSVVHLGDADVRDEHYATDGEHWDSRDSDVALPPYWYFLSGEGRSILRDRLKPELAVGVHVPQAVPHDAAARRDGLRDVDLFTRPGESRTVAH